MSCVVEQVQVPPAAEAVATLPSPLVNGTVGVDDRESQNTKNLDSNGSQSILHVTEVEVVESKVVGNGVSSLEVACENETKEDSWLRDLKIDEYALERGLEDVQALKEVSIPHIWETCDCTACKINRELLTSESYLFEKVNTNRMEYIKALEDSVRRLSNRYKKSQGKTEGSAAAKLEEIHNAEGMIEEVGRYVNYENDLGEFLETLLETEKPKDSEEKSKAPYIISISKRVGRFMAANNRYEYRPIQGGRTITINSSYIIDALRKTATFHPPGLLEKNSFVLDEPFDYIVHHLDKLDTYAIQNPDNTMFGLHLEKLKDVVDEQYGDDIAAENQLRTQSPPRCTFKTLWLLFEKGQDVITKVNGEWRAFVVADTTMGKRLGQGKLASFVVDCWYMDFDGKELGRVQHPEESRFTIFPFQGTKEITSLPIYPMQYHEKNPDIKELRNDLIQRGQRFWKLRKAAQREYAGETLDQVRRYIDNRVMIDYQAYVRAHPDKIILGELELEDKEWNSKPINGCNCVECLESKDDGYKGSTAVFDKYDHILQDQDSLTEHQYMLLTNRVPGFYLQDRSWVMLDVGKLREYETSDQGFRQLVLPPGHTEVIEALIKTRMLPNRAVKRTAYSADIVKGKGKGLIILLHGAPGVGKTSTAECVAEMTNLPLFPITCGDIGTEATEVEKNLKQHFELAQMWNAVLLLDEADVFLQSRDNDGGSLQRNSLVSVFLRVLEYYEGILFLTTNRVGDFDEAFKSRIHVTLYYPQLSEDATKNIWQNLINSLERIRPDISLTAAAESYILENKEVQRTKWNGRQIGNAFQTAVAMAEYEENPLGDKTKFQLAAKHFKRVVELSQKFESYMRDTKGGDDDKLAAAEKLRAESDEKRKKKPKYRDED